MCIRDSVGIVEKVMNDGSIGSTFNEGHLTVEGEDAYCIDTVSYTHLLRQSLQLIDLPNTTERSSRIL